MPSDEPVADDSREQNKNLRTGSDKGRSIRQPTQFLREIRWVYEHPEPVPGEKGSVEGLKLLREMRENEPEKFLARRERLEREHRQGARADQGTGRSDQNSLVAGSESGEAVTAPSLADTGSDRAEFVVDDLLAQHGQPKPGDRT